MGHLVLLGMTVVLGIGAGVAVSFYYLSLPTGLAQSVEVRIPAGTSAREIGVLLEEHGVIRSANVFAVVVRLRDLAHRLKAGTYELDGSRSTAATAEYLLQTPAKTRTVTVPEGLTRHEIAGLLAHQGFVDSARFIAVTEDPAFVHPLGVDAPTLEGYLFPETYFLDVNTSVEEVVEHMVGQFHQVLTDTLRGRLTEIGLTLHQAVTLASIIEREAWAQAERPIISGVFQRRLRLDRKLESCATVGFALGVHKTHLSNDDLLVDSPYNTYRHGGLPPGPIGNPGRASILATLYPVDTSYLYFVARGDGTHIFSHTNGEHEQAKRHLRRLQQHHGQQASTE